MDLLVDLSGPGDRTTRIYQHLLDGIASGRLPPGEKLPASRTMAAELGVARGTVATAYDRLTAEGYLESRVGAGTFVSREVGPVRPASAPAGEVQPLATWERLPAAVPDSPSLEFDLSVAGPDTRLFPFAVWRRLVSATLRPSLQEQPVYDGSGHPRLQAEIARHLRLSRSVVTDGPDILLTGGAQQALDLICRVLLEPGDTVAVEDPGYTAAVRLYASHGAVVRGVSVDEEGLVVDALPDDARLVYVTPSHQFPTGAVMSLRRRTALLDWAVAHHALIVEDDYDSEFRYESRALAPLQSLDRCGRVAYVGSFSKVLMPMLRIGYLVAPRSLQPALRTAKMLTDWQGDTVTQGAMARFLAEGLLAAHVRRATRVYAGRRSLLLRELAALDDVLTPYLSTAGLHVCTRFRDQRRSDRKLVAALAAVGVGVEPLSPRYVEQSPVHGLALGLRHIDEERIPAAVRRIGAALRR
ncbi:GntR family transcriptional regulator [Flexivirga endophytica]|uniref:GntR family transcriptional regulator n=1 Tax=Flexivirga endophytica TaxID=1849103 RepID=A0A916TDZ1_9MICO|nr:PLP-dependent aminotransferase family protein [Flexivirga endophytica]GGB41303.1 GntR family transcriptional regulator [Flexivirga endophytica]GHB49145.1 GntR family transcriptional regulator [Flexivirga endophytica]